MSALLKNPGLKNVDPKAWLQELKSSRKLQVALGVLALMVYLLWPSAPPAAASKGPARTALVPLGDRQAQDLKKLPELANLDKAGELPSDDHMYRDLFLFEGPPPPPPKPVPVPVVIPVPPTPEELAAALLKKNRELEKGSRPQNLRYLGYMGTASSGRLGAFMKGDEPVSIKLGDLANPKWRLIKLTEAAAEFQNLAFQDLHHTLEATEPQSGRSTAPANEF